MSDKISFEVSHNNEENSELFDFIENSINGTIFHHPTFLSYHDENKFPASAYSICHFVFRYKHKIIGFLPGMIYRTTSNIYFYSPCGASFGGLVTEDLSFEKYEQLLDIILNYLLHEKRVTDIHISPPTRIYMGQKVNDYLEYIYLSKGFEVSKSELTIVSPVSSDDAFPMSKYKKRVKSSVRQSENKGVVCRIGQSHEIAYSIIEKAHKKLNKKPTHSLVELKAISRLFPGRILQFIAYYEETPIGAVTLILSNRNVATSFYISHLEDYAKCRPVDFLINKILKWLKEKNYSYLDFGPSTFGYEPHRSLIFFKEGFGGIGIIKHFYRFIHKRS